MSIVILYNKTKNHFIKKGLSGILECNVDFVLLINEKVFLSIPEFPIGEFILYSKKWIKTSSYRFRDFIYNSIETEDNPLIHVYKFEDKYFITSPWQETDEDLEIDLLDWRKAIVALNKSWY